MDSEAKKKYRSTFLNELNMAVPLVMAPMFLVSDIRMVKSGIESGMLSCFPSLNYRDAGELGVALQELNTFINQRKNLPGNYGVNLIVQRSNIYFEKHLQVCLDAKVPVYITSLGNPAPVIEAAHQYGAKVFCDVTNYEHAKKCFEYHCDGFVAVGQGAGGHAGPYPLMLLVTMLKKNFPGKPVMAAGGIADGKSLLSAMAAGADAGYAGTVFISSKESPVAIEYKNAVVHARMKDIVMTDRISGTPCTIINTPFAKKIGLKQTRVEQYLGRNPKTKKYFKMLVQKRGMSWLESAVKPGNYNNLWCAGQSVEMVDEIKPIQQIVLDIMKEFEEAFHNLQQKFS